MVPEAVVTFTLLCLSVFLLLRYDLVSNTPPFCLLAIQLSIAGESSFLGEINQVKAWTRKVTKVTKLSRSKPL